MSSRRRLAALERDVNTLKRQASTSETDARRLRQMTCQILDTRTVAGESKTLDALERIFHHA